MLLKVLTGELCLKSLKPPNLDICTKRQLQEYFENSYDLNESLFTSFKDEGVFYKCPDRLRLPLIFYYCHTAVVYVNKLMLAGLIKERVNLEFEAMFETGVDEMSWDDTENYRMGGSYKWPSLDEVVDYRRKVRNIILKVIQDTPLELPITMESPWWALLMGMEHERIHLETSSVLIRQLPVDMLVKPDGWVYGPMKYGERVNKNPLIRVEEREVTIGKPKDFPSYGWDNEYGQVDCRVPTFEASKYLITNRQFLEFVKAGGYENKSYWTEEAWEWKEFRQAKHPVFWICNKGCKGGCGAELSDYSHCKFPETTIQNGVTNGITNGVSNGSTNGISNVYHDSENNKPQFKYRAMFDIIDLPMDWPVDATYHEARAFCAWMGPDHRLPIEAEHAIMRGEQLPPSAGVKSDIIFQDKIDDNVNFVYGSSTPVNMHSPTSLGFHDVVGNLWEWTEDHFNGLCGYESHWLYDDFSSPCFDGRHNIILGGSWVATGDEASRFARFAFRRHFIQHAGFRIVRNDQANEKLTLPARLVKTDVFVLGLGVLDNPLILETPKTEVVKVPSTNTQYEFDSVSLLEGILELEFGFRKSFPVTVANLCKYYAQMYDCRRQSCAWLGAGTGRGPFEFTNVFQNILAIDFGGRIIDTAMKLQKGEEIIFTKQSGEQCVAGIDDNVNANSITFKQLTWLPNEVDSHDMIIVTFLERTLNPVAWLKRLWEITKEDGVVVIASYDGTWNKEALQPYLENRFKCVSIQEVPFEDSDGQRDTIVTVWK